MASNLFFFYLNYSRTCKMNMNTVSLEVSMVLSSQKKVACKVFYQSTWPMYPGRGGGNSAYERGGDARRKF